MKNESEIPSALCVLLRTPAFSAFAYVLGFVLVVACGGCGGGSTPLATVAVTGIAIPATASVTVGGTVSLTATVTPSSTTNKALTWHSSDGTIASVSSAGVVTGVNAGTASITATSTDGSNITSNVCTATVSLEIPSTPTGLSATPGNQHVSLNWNASSSATSYRVKRAATSGGTYTQIATPTTTSYVNTGLTNDTPYYYVVSAVNSAGESANSGEASATPSGDQVRPVVCDFAASGTMSPVTVSTFTATDDVGVTGYLITESATPPAAGSGSWSASAPTSYSTPSIGTVTLYPWAKDAAGNVSAVYASPVTLTLTTAGQITSLEFGHSGFPAKDYCNVEALPSDFGNGFIFSAWTKITKPVTQGTRRGNQGILYVYGDNWTIVTVNSNIAYNEIDHIWNYNANYMFTEGIGGDFCTYYSTPEDAITLEQCNDWVWVAWQIVVNNDRTITLRQWLKFGLEGTVIPAGNRKYDINFNQIGVLDPPGEETTNVLSFDPSNPRSFRVGVDNTYSGYGTPSSSYICHARLEARSSKPTLLELDAIARLNRADPTAWGDWELNWKDGAPNLSDRSGHGRNLSIQSGGALYQGVLGPAF